MFLEILENPSKNPSVEQLTGAFLELEQKQTELKPVIKETSDEVQKLEICLGWTVKMTGKS